MNFTKLKLVQGDTWSWIESFSSYSAADYDLKLYCKQGFAATLTLTAAAYQTSQFKFDETAANTLQIPAGLYRYQFQLEKGVEKITPDDDEAMGYFEVYPSLAASTDAYGYWYDTYTALQTAYTAAAATGHVEAVSVPGGKTFNYRTLEDLQKALGHAKQMMNQERNKIKGSKGTVKQLISFGNN